jgi:hypothetical protein
MRKSIQTLAITLMLGTMIGAVFSRIIALFLEEGSVAWQLFVRSVDFGPTLTRLDFGVLAVSFGMEFEFNFMSVIGVFVASLILRWYR